jgi:hypothetical protein
VIAAPNEADFAASGSEALGSRLSATAIHRHGSCDTERPEAIRISNAGGTVPDVDPTGLRDSACGPVTAGDWREAALASELLELSSQKELGRFLDGLIPREAGQAVGPAGQGAASTRSATLLRVAAQLLPLAGKPPGSPAFIGRSAHAGREAQPAERAGFRLGLELEGLSAQDREFELARHFVRFARASVGEPGDARSTCCRSGPPRAGHSVRAPELGGNIMSHTQPRQEEYNWRSRRGRRWRDSEYEGEYGASEQEFPPFPPFGQPPGYGGYGWRNWRRRHWGDFEGETQPGGHAAASDHGAGEQQFLPLLPLIGSVLGGLLKETEDEFSGESESGYGEYGEYGESEFGPGESEFGPGESESESGEYGESEFGSGESEWTPGQYHPSEYGEGESEEAEQFLGGIFKHILGGEFEQAGSALSPTHEWELASELLEVSNEEELENFLGNIVSLVGRTMGGIKDFAASPAGQAVIQAVKPLAKAALPAVGAAIGSAVAPGAGSAVGRALGTAVSSLFEAGEFSGEQGEYELAHRVVQLTSAAAKNAVLAPPGAPPAAVGEVSVFHAARRFAPGFYRRGLHRFGYHARRYGGLGYRRHYGGYGHRWGGYRGRPWGGRY